MLKRPRATARFYVAALDEKQHPSARYCVGDVGGERRACSGRV